MTETIIKKDYRNFPELWFLDKFLQKHNGFIVGGCFKNIFQKEPVKDIDIFFTSYDDYKKGILFFEYNEDFSFYYENKNVAAFKDDETGYTIELCKKTFGTPKEILEKFDFTICKFAYIKGKLSDEMLYQVYCHKDFFEHLQRKKLVTDDKVLFPASTFDRMIRYIGYGFTPCYATKVKLVKAINAMDGNNLDINKSLYDGLD